MRHQYRIIFIDPGKIRIFICFEMNRFSLSEQLDEPYSNCRMTDVVIMETVEDRSIGI